MNHSEPCEKPAKFKRDPLCAAGVSQKKHAGGSKRKSLSDEFEDVTGEVDPEEDHAKCELCNEYDPPIPPDHIAKAKGQTLFPTTYNGFF